MAAYRVGNVMDGLYYLQASVTMNPKLTKGWNNLACALAEQAIKEQNQQVTESWPRAHSYYFSKQVWKTA